MYTFTNLLILNVLVHSKLFNKKFSNLFQIGFILISAQKVQF